VGAALLVVALGLVSFVGAVAARIWPTCRPRVAALAGPAAVALALYAFLLAGNQVAVMPFMGWPDLAPAVVGWAALMAVAVRVAIRVRRAGRPMWTAVTGATGVLVAVDGATVLGSLHAAAVLGIGAGSAPAWFPLALMPGGTVRFGPVVAGPPLGPPVSSLHGSDVLLGNASAMVGPLLLCSALLMAYTLRAVATVRAGVVAAGVAEPGTPPVVVTSGWSQVGPRVAASVAVVAAVAVGAALSAVTPDPGAVFARIADNSAVFGFGFATTPFGRAVLILIIGVCLAGPARRGAATAGQRA
jgi:hypothetical protein